MARAGKKKTRRTRYGATMRFHTVSTHGLRALVLTLLLASAAAAKVPFANPAELVSQNGVMAATLTIEPAQLKVAGKNVTFPALYDGQYTPPLLRVQPGDLMQITVRNYVQTMTNIHYHGLDVTPAGPGDNVYVIIDAGGSFQNVFLIPPTQSAGLFWYHPHLDPELNTQLGGGMAGGIIVGDILAPFPELQGIPERVMLLKDLKLSKGQPVFFPAPAGPTRRTINGLWKPRLEMQPGQLEFWRIGNQSVNIYYKLRFDGQPFYVIAVDGNLQNQAIETKTLIIPPGSRFEVLVYGPKKRGTYRLKAEKFDTGPDGDAYPGQILATIVSKGSQATQIPIPAAFPVVPDLRDGPIAKQRTIVFADTDDPNLFTIGGKPFNGECVDTIVNLGDVEEWTIQNTAQENHVFHIHQLEFQVTEINGVPQPFTGRQDVVTLPAASKSGPSTVKMLLPFTNPVIVGKFVYHCHIIQHEVQGMMASIYVVDPAAPPPDITQCDASTTPDTPGTGHGGHH